MTLSSAIAAALRGESPGVLLLGASGAQRAAAVQEALDALDSPFVLHSAVGTELRRAEPFAILCDLFPLREGMSHEHSGTAADRRTVDEAIDTVDALLAETAVVILVDDVDLADSLSVHGLCAIAAEFAERPCAVIATQAAREVSRIGSRLVRTGLATLALEAAADEPAAVVLAELGDAAANIVAAATVLGMRFEVDQLAVIAETTPIALLAPLDRALSAGVLIDDARQLSFRSIALVEDVRSELDEQERRALHATAARALEASGAPPATIALQHIEAQATNGFERLSWIRAAAAATETAMPEITVDILERAAALEPASSPQRSAIAAATIAPLVRVGRVTDALGVAAALDFDDLAPTEALGALAGAAMGSERVGNRTTAASMWERAADLPGLPDRFRAEALAHAARAWLLSGNTERGELLARDAETRGRLRGDAPATSVAVATLALAALAAGDTSAGVRRAAEALAIDAGGANRWGGYPDPRAVHGTALLADDRLEEALHAFESGRRAADVVGIGTTQAQFQFDVALCHLLTGALDDADAAIEAGLVMAHADETDLGVPIAHAIAARIALHRGLPQDAELAVSRAKAIGSATGEQYGAELVDWVHALTLEAKGDLAAARSVMSAAWERTSRLRFLPSNGLLAVDLVRIAAGADDTAVAERVLMEVASGTIAIGALCRAVVSRDLAHARQAVEILRSGPRRLELARALEIQASLLAATGDQRSAGDAIHESASIYDDCGAAGDVQRCTETSRLLGLRRKTSRGRAPTGWAALTKTEVSVARLVASGLANREVAEELYVSRHTIESHLRQIFGKLGVRSRVELGNYVARHG